MLRGVNPRMSDFHALAFFQKLKELYLSFGAHTACKQYCLAAGATQGNIAYTQNVKKSYLWLVAISKVLRKLLQPSKKIQ